MYIANLPEYVSTRFVYKETAEIVSINPLYPPIFGGLLKLGNTPRPPAGSILHLFFSGLIRYRFVAVPRVQLSG
jgi:hypothetical protein